jgi:hypothetical protein
MGGEGTCGAGEEIGPGGGAEIDPNGGACTGPDCIGISECGGNVVGIGPGEAGRCGQQAPERLQQWLHPANSARHRAGTTSPNHRAKRMANLPPVPLHGRL